MSIKMIGLDLDGTALDPKGHFSDRVKEAFAAAMRQGIHIVIATGRPQSALPKEIWQIEGLEYVMTANGSRIIRTVDDKPIYENYLEPSVVDRLREITEENGLQAEIFVEGTAYIGRPEWDAIMAGKSFHRSKAYVSSTRTPVDDIYGWMTENRTRIEDMVINYDTLEEKEAALALLREVPDITITSASRLNNEIGSATASKANGLRQLMEMLGVKREELMVCGDSPNDIAMIRFAGLGVAMGNALDSVKEAADVVTLSNAEDGVAAAIERYAL